jgi:hypothetical protein
MKARIDGDGEAMHVQADRGSTVHQDRVMTTKTTGEPAELVHTASSGCGTDHDVEERKAVGVDSEAKVRYLGALSLQQFVAQATANHELWASFAKRAVPAADLLARVNRLPARRHLLVLLEDWCGDAVNTIPALAALTAASNMLDLRILARDTNLDLMTSHLTEGTLSIPVVIVLDEHYRELGWWGPRPAPLQSWVRAHGQALDKSDRYREVRRWYARDRAQTTLHEIIILLEHGSEARAA